MNESVNMLLYVAQTKWTLPPVLFDLGFLSISIWDVLDILIVGYLIFQVYKLLRGSIAFNIFIGMVLLYLLWWIVRALKMELLSL